MNLIEKSMQIIEKYHNPNDGEVFEILLDTIKRYKRFIDRALELAEYYEKQDEKLSKKFYDIAEKYDNYVETVRIRINKE